MKNNKRKVIASIIVAVSLLLGVFALASAKENKVEQVSNVCAQHPNRMWAWTLDGAFLSMTRTGNWETDSLFYMLKPGEPVIVTKIDNGYYLVCYDFGSDSGWNPLSGWVQDDFILLQSQITPVAPEQ